MYKFDVAVTLDAPNDSYGIVSCTTGAASLKSSANAAVAGLFSGDELYTSQTICVTQVSPHSMYSLSFYRYFTRTSLGPGVHAELHIILTRGPQIQTCY